MSAVLSAHQATVLLCLSRHVEPGVWNISVHQGRERVQIWESADDVLAEGVESVLAELSTPPEDRPRERA